MVRVILGVPDRCGVLVVGMVVIGMVSGAMRVSVGWAIGGRGFGRGFVPVPARRGETSRDREQRGEECPEPRLAY